MISDRLDLLIGLILGLFLGGFGVYVMVQVRGWFTSPEVRKLRDENRKLSKRIDQKDKYIEEMLRRAEDIALQMQKEKS